MIRKERNIWRIVVQAALAAAILVAVHLPGVARPLAAAGEAVALLLLRASSGS